MASRTHTTSGEAGFTRGESGFKRMGIKPERRPVPIPSLGQVAAAVVDRWMAWGLVAVGLVLLYVSLYVMDDGPFDDLLFGLLTLVAIVVSVQQTYARARVLARERSSPDATAS